MGGQQRRYSLKVFNGTQRFISFFSSLSRSLHVTSNGDRSSRSDVDHIFQVSKSFTEINEAEIDEKYL